MSTRTLVARSQPTPLTLTFRRIARTFRNEFGDAWLIASAHMSQIAAQLNVPPDPYPHLRRLAAGVRVQTRRDTVAERREWRTWLDEQRAAARRDLRLTITRAEITCGVADYTPANVTRGTE